MQVDVLEFSPSLGEKLKEKCGLKATRDSLVHNDPWMHEHLKPHDQDASLRSLKNIPLYDVLGRNVLKMNEEEFNACLDKAIKQSPALCWQIHTYSFLTLNRNWLREAKVCSLYGFLETLVAMLELLNQEGSLHKTHVWCILVSSLLKDGWNALQCNMSLRNIFTVTSFQTIRGQIPTLGMVTIHYSSKEHLCTSSVESVQTIRRGSLESKFIESHSIPLCSMSHLFENQEELESMVRAAFQDGEQSRELQDWFAPPRRRVFKASFDEFFYHTPLHVHEVFACLYLCSMINSRVHSSPRLVSFIEKAGKGWLAFKDPDFRGFFGGWQAPVKSEQDCSAYDVRSAQERETRSKSASMDPIFYDSVESYLHAVDFDAKVLPERLHEQFVAAALRFLRSRWGRESTLLEGYKYQVLSVMNIRYGNDRAVESYIAGYYINT
ncbi:hypothetical protein GUITHDRAFT_119433 [Guillardia theta CCMP2712]|uniref:Uncharacterized protein n=1 Tax=Guillardia theta (strain CCMP2712) TaxID=905079 RepID=L1IDT7_GUITC|nr:hypothetical protein GUITHDRAFT_119433 [Guillardia theta CCMP2712]EKX34426.1 hypothetical protein GUITHDRAFT_119433 [Guillardia theta CCMP2712]|eukprot:XP_005821406.1 hypothetical protein GUITHDRAFT_119433 [Guillardia theta CCMP2712]